MPTSRLIKGSKIFQSSIDVGSILSNLSILSNNVYKVTYYEIISGASGSATLPSGASINSGEFSGSNCVLSEIDVNNKPTYVTPLTGGGTPVTSTLNVGTGAWIKSGVTASTNVALIYSVNITALNYSNLNNFYIIENVLVPATTLQQVLTNTTLNSVTSLSLLNAMSDETGTGALVFRTSPTFTTDITTPKIIGNTAINGLLISSSTTASAGLVNGIYHTPTLIAAANGDILSAIKISPTYTLGAFTGTTKLGIDVNGGGIRVRGYADTVLDVGNSFGVLTAVASSGMVTAYALTVSNGNLTVGTTTPIISLNNSACGLSRTSNDLNVLFYANLNFNCTNGNTTPLILTNTALTFSDGINLVFNTTTGSKLASAANQKLGIWGATPIVQPTTGVAAATIVNGSGTNALQDDTYDGYTLAKVVKALRNTGILA